MAKNIPTIDDLTKGINDSDLFMENDSNEEPQQETIEEPVEEPKAQEPMEVFQNEDFWNRFQTHIETDEIEDDKDERLICKLDRCLADSLDECDINKKSRSDLVNAVVRTFFDFYLPKLAKYRRENKSLFTNYKYE